MRGGLRAAVARATCAQAFFAEFPEYESNDFYVAGESYGGIYVPTLSAQILESGRIKGMKGFMARGPACTNSGQRRAACLASGPVVGVRAAARIHSQLDNRDLDVSPG